MRIPFNVKYRPQIESGEYRVETGDGNPARIICWDACESEPIVAVVSGLVHQYTIKGYANYLKDNDLFIVTPEPELTDFEQEVSDIVEYCKKNGKIVADGYAKRHAKSLLSLAHEQLKPDINLMLEDNYKTAYKKGYDEGRVDALKDLPRWKKVGLNTGQTTLVIGYTNDEDKLYRNGYVISLTDLEKLLKEDKK